VKGEINNLLKSYEYRTCIRTTQIAAFRNSGGIKFVQ